ncbi:hypothetical protein IV55_GL000948 [Furfurilactobacillus siliginis]|uniref:Abortive phage infection protein C-terminal domain-containing protein n=1 Tax=Furfurilactobacillus siliginis TaxID=348151 RepID=A0A0R2KW00_9LACO|nr:AIPR family protein [Furfurilactobacillus siliginis]KRN93759.1 hypothetical protein IV55_GL000948 [Furfurilactobacillus siliginis]
MHEKSEETGLSNLIYGLAKYLFVNFSIDVFEDEDGLAKILHGICDTAFFNMLSDSEITEKYDDAGIDAIVYIDKYNEIIDPTDIKERISGLYVEKIVLFQSKSKNGQVHETFSSFTVAVSTLLNHKQAPQKLNPILKKFFTLFKDRLLSNTMLYPAVGLIEKGVAPEYEAALERALKMFQTDGILEESNVSVPDSWHDLILDKNLVNFIPDVEPIKEDRLVVADKMEYGYPGTSIQSYVLMVYVKDYLNFLTNPRKENLLEGLFIDNVRDNAGNNSVNKMIKETFLQGPQRFEGDFWWLSNGITIICDSITENSSKTLDLGYPRIVNGQQTSRQLFAAQLDPEFIENNPQFSPWKLMVKLLVLNTDDTSDERKDELDEIKNRVIEGVNSQTAIGRNTIQLNNDFTKTLQTYLRSRDVPREKRVNIEIRSGEYSKNPLFRNTSQRILKVETIIQYMLCSNWFIKGLSIGKIRSSKSVTISKNLAELLNVIQNRVDNRELWVYFVNVIMSFELNWQKELDKNSGKYISGIWYLKFAVFRLMLVNADAKFDLDGMHRLRDQDGLIVFQEGISWMNSIMVDQESEKREWDNFSKTDVFEKLLRESIENRKK